MVLQNGGHCRREPTTTVDVSGLIKENITARPRDKTQNSNETEKLVPVDDKIYIS